MHNNMGNGGTITKKKRRSKITSTEREGAGGEKYSTMYNNINSKCRSRFFGSEEI